MWKSLLIVAATMWTLTVTLLATSKEAGAASSCARVDLTIVETRPSAETRPVKIGDETIHVRRDAIAANSDITELKVLRDDIDGDDIDDALILIKYKPEAAARVLEATTNHDGVRLAFVVNDDVWLAITWQGPYGIGPDGTQLSIRNGFARAQMLMQSIKACGGNRTL